MPWVREKNRSGKDRSSKLVFGSHYEMLVVHRHIDTRPDAWVMTCHAIDVAKLELHSSDLGAAEQEAYEYTKQIMTERLSNFIRAGEGKKK